MNEHYYRARRLLIISSAILLFWQLMGASLTAASDSIDGGGRGVLINNPDSIRVMVFIGVVYFMARLYLQWKLCDEKYRILTVARIDFIVCYTIAVLIVILFGLIEIGAHRIDNLLRSPFVVSFSITASISIIFSVLSADRKRGALEEVPFLFVFLFFVCVIVLTPKYSTPVAYLGGIFSGLMTSSILWYVLKFIDKPNEAVRAIKAKERQKNRRKQTKKHKRVTL